MSAFASAWQLLKALPEQQGYMGTLPRSIQGYMERARAQGGRGPVQHFPIRGMERNPKTGEMARTGPFRSEPVDAQDIQGLGLPEDYEEGLLQNLGEELPASNRRIERDLSPLQEAYQTMVSHGINRHPGTRKVVPSTSMANVMGHELMPEESFYTPREARLAREGMEQSAGRQLTQGQRGGRMDMTGGSKSGSFLPLRGEKDSPDNLSGDIRVQRRGAERQKYGRHRRAANLGNVEGMRQGARLGGASREFTQEAREAEREEKRAPTQEERIAAILGHVASREPLPSAELGQDPQERREMQEKFRNYKMLVDSGMSHEAANKRQGLDSYGLPFDADKMRGGIYRRVGGEDSMGMGINLDEKGIQQAIAQGKAGQEVKEKEAPLPRNERLRPMGRRAAERLEQSKTAMPRPNLDIPQQPGMAEMFADPSGPEGQAAMQNFQQVDSSNRARLMQMAKEKALEQANINRQG